MEMSVKIKKLTNVTLVFINIDVGYIGLYDI